MIAALVLTLVLVLGACQNALVAELDRRIQQDVALVEAGGPPEVVSTTPQADAGNVPLTIVMEIEFSQDFSVDSLARAIIVHPEEGDAVAGTTDYIAEEKTVTFTPDVLAPGTTYTVTVIANEAETLTGLNLEADYSFAFTTASRPVVSFTPSDGATEVPLDGRPVVTFDRLMDPASAEAAVTLETAGGTGVASATAYNEDNRTVRITPDNLLERDTTYRIVVAETASSARGATLGETVSSSFATLSVAADELRIDMTYDGNELSASKPVYYYFEWNDGSVESAVIGPVTSDGTTVVSVSNLSGDPATEYRLMAYHDRNNSYASTPEIPETEWPTGHPQLGIDYRHYYLSLAENNTTDFIDFLFNEDGSPTDGVSDYFDPNETPTRDWSIIRNEALMTVGNLYEITLKDKPFFDPPSAGAYEIIELGQSLDVDVVPYTRKLLVFEAPEKEWYRFRVTKPQDLGVDIRLWGLEEEPYDAPAFTRFSANTADIPSDGDRALTLWDIYGMASMEQAMATQYVYQSPMRKYDSDYNYPDPSTRQEYYVLEILSLDDDTFDTLWDTGTITIDGDIRPVGADTAEANDNDTRADADTTYDEITVGAGTPAYFTLQENDVDWLRLDDGEDGSGMVLRIRAAHDAGSAPSYISNIPDWLKAYTDGSSNEHEGNRVLQVTVGVVDGTGTSIATQYASSAGGPYGTAQNSHTFDLAFDESDPAWAVAMNELLIPDFYGETRYVRIQNVTPLVDGVAGLMPSGGYMVDAADEGGGGK